MRAFARRHALYDGFNALEGVVVDVYVLDGLAHAGNHAGQVLQVAHLLYLLDLRHEVVEVELVFRDFLLQPACFLFVILFLRLLHERHDVAHAEDAVGHARGVELVDGLHLFARTDEFDGLVHHRADGEGRAAAGVAVQFGEHHAVEVQPVVELLCRVHGVLSRHGVHHEERFVRLYGVLDGGDFLHHLFVHGQSSGGVDDDYVVAFGLGLLDGILRDGHGVLAVRFAVYGYADLFAQHFQLFDGGGAVDVAGCQQRVLVLLVLQHQGELAREGGLSRAVEARHEDDGRMALQVQFGRFASHEGGQLVVHDFHHQLAGLHGGEHVLPQRLLLHRVGERLGHLVVHVGVEQCAAHVLEGFGHIDFGDFPFTFQYLERPFESFAQVVEHI